MAPEVKTAKNSKLPKMSENCFEPVGKGGWPPISIWINGLSVQVAIGYMDKWTNWLYGQSDLENASKEATWIV
jgi:hypothetical protein